MKKIIVIGVAALALAGTASAQPWSKTPGDITRAAAIADAEQRFASMDANGNGTLEPAEKQKAAEQRRAERRQRMEQRLATMSAEERAQFEQRRAERGKDGTRRGSGEGRRSAGGSDGGPTTLAQFRARAEQRFDRLDLDHNGVITTAEQAQLKAQRGHRSK